VLQKEVVKQQFVLQLVDKKNPKKIANTKHHTPSVSKYKMF
jgi:hypothetical protein